MEVQIDYVLVAIENQNKKGLFRYIDEECVSI